MIISHKKVLQILKNWNLENEPITDIYYEGTGNKNDSACYVGDKYVLKYTGNLGKLKNHIKVSKAIESVGLMSATPILTADGQQYIQDNELYFYLTRRLNGQQMVSGSFYDGDAIGNARFVGEIIGQLHLALSKIEDCVSEADRALPQKCSQSKNELTAYPLLNMRLVLLDGIIHRNPLLSLFCCFFFFFILYIVP